MTAPGRHAPARFRGDGPGWSRIVVRVMIIALVVGVAYLAYGALRESRSLNVGDCVTGLEPHQEKADCSDPSALFVVLEDFPSQVTVPRDDKRDCLDVDGVTARSSADRRTLCLGHVGGDPARSINSIAAGECMTVAGADAQRSDCSAPDAARVVAVLDHYAGATDADRIRACEESGAAGTEVTHSWGLIGELDRRTACMTHTPDHVG